MQPGMAHIVAPWRILLSDLTSSSWLGVYALAPLLKFTCRSIDGSSTPNGGAAAAPAVAAADSLV
jgi:hypothetical protein